MGRSIACALVALVALGAGCTGGEEARAQPAKRAAKPKAPLVPPRDVAVAIRDATVGVLGDATEGAKVTPDREQLFYTLTLPEGGPAVDAEAVARTMVTAAIKTFMAAGHDPKVDWLNIHAFVDREAGTSPTGRPSVVQLGHAWYDFSADRIDFERD